MLEILFSWLSPIRFIFIYIDSIAFSLIDSAYDLIVTFSSGTLFNNATLSAVRNNMYFVIGLIALFKIAMLLVNSIINPDKLNEKGSGLSNVLTNFIVMIVLLIMTPYLFGIAMDVQKKIVEGHYIESLFIDTGAMKGKNPGKAMRSLVIGSLITIDEEAQGSSNCGSNCEEAIEDYEKMAQNGSFSIPKLSKHIGVSIKNDDGEVVYVYNYMLLVTFAAGVFVTYVLLSFGIDIAVRMVELSVLIMVSPLFIATYIDPKSAKSGPFHKWLTTFGKTYASLFIKLASVALMLLFVSLLTNMSTEMELSAFEKLILLFAILMFAKKAPKWLGDMLGVEGGIGGLGIGKKLGGAALVGGATGKGLEGAKKFAGKKGKNFAANRVRNTAARVGGMKEARMANKSAKKNGTYDPNKKQSIFKQGKAAAKASRQANWGKDSQGLIKDVGSGYISGRRNLNPEAETLNEKFKRKATAKATAYNANIGNTPEEMANKVKSAAQMKTAAQMRIGKPATDKMGARDKIKAWQGYNEFKSAIGSDVLTEEDAYIKDAYNNGLTYDKNTGKFSDGRTISQYKNSFTEAGQKDIKAFVTKNVQSQTETLSTNVELRNNNNEKIAKFNSEISKLASTNNLSYGQQTYNEIQKAKAEIALLPPDPSMDTADQATKRAAAQEKIAVYSADKDYRAYEAVSSYTNQANNLIMQNATINNQISSVVKGMQNAEAKFKKPTDCPSSVQVGDDYYTSVGKYTAVKDQNGSVVGYNYEKLAGSDNPETFNIDPTKQPGISARLAHDASDNEDKAKKAHDAMEPKTS